LEFQQLQMVTRFSPEHLARILDGLAPNWLEWSEDFSMGGLRIASDALRVLVMDSTDSELMKKRHHRLAAAERMKLPTVPVRVYEGSEADAITYAWTSNIMTRTQTNVENAGYLRKLRSNGVSEAAIKRTCDEYYSKDCATVFALSHVPATAIVFDDMSAFTAASDEYKELETMARWLGIVCKQHDTLTVSQVNELYRFLRKNFRISGRRFRSAAEFSEYVDKALATRFPIGTNDGTALNLENLRPRTDTEKAFDAREAEITQEIADEKKLIETQRTKLLKVDELRAKGIPATAEPILDSMRKSEQRIASLQRELMELRDQRSEAIGKAVESQPALFGLRDTIRGRYRG
jgi:hypothetical protein